MERKSFRRNEDEPKTDIMKRFILIFTLVFAASSAFYSCKDAEREAEEIEIAEEDLAETNDYEEGVMDEGFGAYDANSDDMLDENEFGEANQTAFSDWDEDEDSSLSNEEFYGSTFGVVDANNDDRIDENEWNENRENLYVDYSGDEDWDLFDRDEDGFLSSDEWSEGFADSNWFNDFDANDDQLVDNSEWNSGLFDDWDANDDGFLDQNEYRYNPSS